MQEEEMNSRRSTTPYGIIRRSIHTFLQSYHLFAASAALLAFPASAAILLSQLFVYSSPTFRLLNSRLRSVFESAGFPPAASPFASLLSSKLAQTISSSLFSLPFTLTFLIFTKSSIILLLSRRSAASFLRLYNPLLATQMCNFFIILAANSAALSIMFLTFSLFHILGLSSPRLVLFLSSLVAVLYSIILANAAMICNLAVTVAGMENCSGCLAIVKACVLIRGKVATALSLALPINLILAAVEALFQYRVVKAYHLSKELNSSFIWEPPLIVYLYSTIIVLDTIMSCVFYRSCKVQNLTDLDLRNYDQMEYAEDGNDDNKSKNANGLQLFP